MLQDLKFALRLFRKHPAPVGIAIGGLALAIAVVASVFTIADQSMLRPYGMDDPHSVYDVSRPRHGGFSEWSYSTFLKIRDEVTLTRVEASSSSEVRIGSTPAAGDVRRWMQFVSGRYLQTFGGRPALGRTLDVSDDLPGAPPVIVVSEFFWASRLNRDPSAVGTTLWLNGAPVTVVGVLRAGFTGPASQRPSIWAPFAAFDDVRGGPPFDANTKVSVQFLTRLTPGTGVRAAEAEMDAAMKRATASASKPASPAPVVELFRMASPLDRENPAEAWTSVAVLGGILGLVLAVACANTANLLLAAATTRMPEMGVRLAMGASTGRVIRQMVSESVLLGLIAGGLGFLLAIWFAPILGTMLEMSPEFNAAPDGRVLLITSVIALICGLGAGLSPARHGARGSVLAALKSQRGSHGHVTTPSRLRASFVGFQAAASMLLLVCAVLLARTAIRMTSTDIGFDADRLLAVSFEGRPKDFNEPAYTQAALAVVRELPAIEHASVSQNQPFGFSVERERFTHRGRTFQLSVHRADAEYFPTVGLRVLRGRAFTVEEVAREAPVALISETVAREFFGLADAVGQSLSMLPAEDGTRQQPSSIIGVVADAMLGRVRTEVSGQIYRPLPQVRANPPDVLLRTLSPGLVARAVEDAVRRVDPRIRPTTRIVREGLDAFLGSKQLLARVAAPLAVLVLVLAVVGMFGVTAFVVGQRTKEVSLRIALGGSPADVLRLLIKDSLRPVVIGLVIGLGAALAVSRVSAENLPGISPHDPLSIGIATSLLVAGALLAVIVPARRAAKANPAALLREV